jgi:16S rRNA (guanine527-N7)-methyltransferase
MSLEPLQQALAPWGARAAEIEAALVAYVDLVLVHNRATNLIGPLRREEIFSQLILDALLPALALGLEAPAGPVMDIGSGAGLPGIPLSILWGAAAEVHLVEPRRKRVEFLELAASSLGLAQVKVHGGRVETLDKALSRRFAATAAKAFKPPLEYLEAARPWLKPGGFAFLYVSARSWGDEQARGARKLGFHPHARLAHPVMPDRAGLVLVCKS